MGSTPHVGGARIRMRKAQSVERQAFNLNV
jgi:hypothetical protein